MVYLLYSLYKYQVGVVVEINGFTKTHPQTMYKSTPSNIHKMKKIKNGRIQLTNNSFLCCFRCGRIPSPSSIDSSSSTEQ